MTLFSALLSKLTNGCLSLRFGLFAQEQVNSAPVFTEVLKQMEEWMTSHRLGCGKKFAVVTDGLVGLFFL
jgi:inhibitor of KinA sporulation pathway (predicted exonuclease)